MLGVPLPGGENRGHLKTDSDKKPDATYVVFPQNRLWMTLYLLPTDVLLGLCK